MCTCAAPGTAPAVPGACFDPPEENVGYSERQKIMKKKAFRAALPYTLPICVGFLLIGASYGLLMRSKGFSVWYPMAMSALIYAGSMEFVTVNLLLSAFRPLYAFLLTLMVSVGSRGGTLGFLVSMISSSLP